ncbi:MAG: prepilin-type N-terminal cleavage/methylation domain-containing protein [Polynucleobacter sp.]|nr:prepilin-type N-terminal cleavage/methylation domain-containing protein [Polynucleobacter sp.]
MSSWIRILETGKKKSQGFTLIEFLVVLVILSVVLGLATLRLPNQDQRYFQDRLEQLTAGLNIAQDESVITGVPILVQIDPVGWRFYQLQARNQFRLLQSPLAPQVWHKKVELSGLTELVIGQESIAEPWSVEIKQEQFKAQISKTEMRLFQLQIIR